MEESPQIWERLNDNLYYNSDYKIFCRREISGPRQLHFSLGMNPNKLTYFDDIDSGYQWAKQMVLD